MGGGFQFIDIILFAMIAAFIILRLRSVLGRRQDHHPRPRDHFSTEPHRTGQDDNVVQLPDQSDHYEDAGEGPESPAEAEPASTLQGGFADIARVMPDFDQEEFMVGARTAFEMIVQAFAEGDTDLLHNLLSDEVYNNFLQAIRAREANKQTLENTLVRIRTAEPLEAYLDGRSAFVTVKIVSEQVNVTRDAEGNTVAGDANHIAEVTDIWTFAHDVRSRDPNWELVATRSLD